MDIKLSYGPWETVFVGQTYGHEVEVLVNPEHFYIIIIYDKREGIKFGAVIEGYKAFLARGPMEAFVQTMPKPCFGMEKNLGDKTSKLFFMSFEPFYVSFREEDYERKIDAIISKTEESSATIIDLARASAVDLKDISASARAEYAPILGDPMSIMSMILGRKDSGLKKMDLGAGAQETDEDREPVIQLGLGKKREIIRENSANIYRSQIMGGGEAAQYSAYIFAENMLMENVPVIIVDDKDYYRQLGVLSQNPSFLKEELVDFEPIAFPVKVIRPKQEIKVSLKDADLVFLLGLLGLKDDEFVKNLSLFAFASQLNTPAELAKKVFETKELTEYEKLRAERMLMIMDKCMPNIFGEEYSSEELTRLIPGKIARAIVIDTRGITEDEKALFVHTLLRQLTKSAAVTEQIKSALIMPDISALLRKNPERVSSVIMRMENRGIGAVLGSPEAMPQELEQTLTTKVTIVSGKDVAISIKGKRNYRLNLRPSLSGSPKF